MMPGRAQQIVDQAVLAVEQPAEHLRGHDGGHGPRHQHRRPDDRAADEGLEQQERHAEAQDGLQQGRDEGEHHRVAPGVPERLVAQQRRVVGEPDEVVLLRHQRGVGQGQPDAVQDRVDRDRSQRHEHRQQEQPGRQRQLAPAGPCHGAGDGGQAGLISPSRYRRSWRRCAQSESIRERICVFASTMSS